MLDQNPLTIASQPVSGPLLVERSPWSAEASVPPPADAAVQRVVRQFVEALLFEGLVTYTTSPRPTTEPFASMYPMRIGFEVGELRYRCAAATTAFSRVRVMEGSIRRLIADDVDEHCVHVANIDEASIATLIDALPIAAAAKQRLHTELSQTVELSRWNLLNLEHQRVPRRTLGFQALESAIVEGHLYHPSFKSRTGFTLRDHQDYGSEASNRFQLQWLAVRRGMVRFAVGREVATPDEEHAFWQQELDAQTYVELTSRLALRGETWSDYVLVPAHPWQLSSLREGVLSKPIADGTIVALGGAGDAYHASQSLRTLVNATHPTKANVKLPLNIVCTSALRNLEPHFVCTAPVLSDWLVSLVEHDVFLQANQHLMLLREYAGIAFEPCVPTSASEEERLEAEALEGLVGAIYRESVNGKLRSGQAAVPFTALMLVECDGRPFIADWVDAYGVERWVNRLLEVMLIPLWHMLVHHGVAFEAHAQNLILVHTGGWPEKIVLRDFHEDTEFVTDYLSKPELAPDFARVDSFFADIPDDDGYRMASTDALRELFMDCVYVYNLADLSFLLARFHGFPEERLWSLVRAQLDAYASSGVTDRSRIERIASTEPEIIVESLLTKKIMDGGVLDYFEHSIRNTLGS
jgi:3,4-dihydroxybenzoyl-citryl-spermidine/N-citryl-spermidine--spermidine ligase